MGITSFHQTSGYVLDSSGPNSSWGERGTRSGTEIPKRLRAQRGGPGGTRNCRDSTTAEWEEECPPAGRRGQGRAGPSAWCGDGDGSPVPCHGYPCCQPKAHAEEEGLWYKCVQTARQLCHSRALQLALFRAYQVCFGEYLKRFSLALH